MKLAEGTLKHSMDTAVGHYSSLFRLPSGKKIILLLALLCVGGSLLSTAVVFPSFGGFLDGLLLGLALFGLSLLADYCTSLFVLGKDTIFDLRRVVALSLFCLGLWFFFDLVGSLVASVFGLSWWIRLWLLGFSAAMILRMLVFNSTSSMNRKRLFISSLFQPLLCIVPFVLLWLHVGYPFTVYVPLFFVLAAAMSYLAPSVFLLVLNRVGEKTVGIPSVSLFRAFMLNWVLNLNAPFEELLEELGEQRDIKVSFLEFVTSKGMYVLVVPSVHPGPFRNIGSSVLPSLLKFDLEREFNCVVSVPHGLLGHEFDLASQRQNNRIVASVAAALRKPEFSEVAASPFVKVTNGLATACCQIFGRAAFISFTLAPKTIEDLPDGLGLFVREEARKHGLDLAAVINAHNSLDSVAEMEGALNSLKEVAAKCLKKVVSMERLPVAVGSASVFPKEFDLEDGMGPGGITAIVMKNDEQKVGYVMIDGNNMVSGLREEILSFLSSLGFDDGEVFTTDTHAVSALVLSSRGYHPVGEVMDREKLLGYIREAVMKAEAVLGEARFSYGELTVPDVKVIGAKQLESLCLLIDKALRRAKLAVAPVFAFSGLALMLLLLLV